jgi:raffinose/stachyose/melibiose transport system substrate-binding protein
MDRTRRLAMAGALALLVALLAVVAAGCGGTEEAAPPAAAPPAEPTPAEPAPAESEAPAESTPAEPAGGSGLGSEFDVASAGDVTLKLWWLGDLEAPGIEAWMDQMIQEFQTEYPNVKVEATTYDTNTWIQTQQTACQSKTGADLWYNWSGTWSLELAWKGCTVPNEEVLAPADIEANRNVQETIWDGKGWVLPLYRFVYPIVVNLDLIQQAGLDPNAPPTTWEEWTAALDKIKAANITPIALGLKDGFGGEIAAAGQLEKQWVNVPDDIKQLVIDGDFTTDEGWVNWLEKLFELKPYFNDDANSLTFADGLALWQNGKTAMVFGAPGVQSVIKAAQDAGMNVGLLRMPPFDDGDWAESLAQTGQGFQVTQWSENKEVAGAFMAFLQEPENAEALYEATGNFPATTNWDPAGVTSPTDQQMLSWLQEKDTAWWAANYTPVDLDVNGTFVVFQKMMAGELADASAAAQVYQDVIEKWREASPDAVTNFQSWLGS